VAQTPDTFVTWSTYSYQVSLPKSVGCGATGTGTVTATANVDMGPTPHYIEIYRTDHGVRLASCGTGTTCTAQFQCGSIGLVAFISSDTPWYPPDDTQASSNTVIPTVSLP
jgi:hypothetical protein